MTEPRDKTIWLTGASSGIGEALTHALNRAGANLILSARSEDKLNAIAEARADKTHAAHVLPLDMGALDTLEDKAQAAATIMGPIDMLILNAGIGQRAFALETDPSVTEEIMRVNFLGVARLARAVAAAMVARGEGHIVITSSVLGKVGIKNRSSYCASKHALHGYFDSMRAELHDKNIRITLICPGYVHTNISVTARTGDGTQHNEMDAGQTRGISAEECARRYVKAMRQNKEERNVGGIEVFGVNIKRFLPGLYSRIARSLKTE